MSQIPNFRDTEWLSIVASIMSFSYSIIGSALGLAKVIGMVNYMLCKLPGHLSYQKNIICNVNGSLQLVGWLKWQDNLRHHLDIRILKGIEIWASNPRVPFWWLWISNPAKSAYWFLLLSSTSSSHLGSIFFIFHRILQSFRRLLLQFFLIFACTSRGTTPLIWAVLFSFFIILSVCSDFCFSIVFFCASGNVRDLSFRTSYWGRRLRERCTEVIAGKIRVMEDLKGFGSNCWTWWSLDSSSSSPFTGSNGSYWPIWLYSLVILFCWLCICIFFIKTTV